MNKKDTKKGATNNPIHGDPLEGGPPEKRHNYNLLRRLFGADALLKTTEEDY